MIFVTAKFEVRPEDAERWPEITRAFTTATRAEPGCLWFAWSRSLDNPNRYVLVEAFRDGDSGGHRGSTRTFCGGARPTRRYVGTGSRSTCWQRPIVEYSITVRRSDGRIAMWPRPRTPGG
jgi:quinol monooxygenase YgiN